MGGEGTIYSASNGRDRLDLAPDLVRWTRWLHRLDYDALVRPTALAFTGEPMRRSLERKFVAGAVVVTKIHRLGCGFGGGHGACVT